MKDLKNSLRIKPIQIFIYLSFVLFSSQLIGQIDLSKYEKDFGKNLTTIKKKINISFVYDENSHSYMAKVKHQIQRLYIGNKDKSGLVQVPFNKFQKLKLSSARYFRIDSLGKKILLENVKVKYSDEKNFFINNIFYSDFKVKQFKCSLSLPDNYLVTYSYEVLYKDLKFLNSFFFQYNAEAVEDVEISIKKNSNVKFSIYDFNLKGIDKIESDSYIKYTGKNLSRYKSSSVSVSGNYYLPHIIISVDETNNDGETIQILKSTDDLYEWYNSLIKELKPDMSYINNLANSIIGNSTDDSEKIDKIFRWVQNNVQYVAFEDGIAGFKPDEADNVAKSKFGDCKGIANLLVNLLKSQGLNAKHAWLGTRSKNYDYNIPSLVVDNHMICGLEFNNKMYFLDGTSKSVTWLKAPSHLEGKQVLVAKDNAYEILTIEKSNPLDNVIDITGVLDLSKSQPTIDLSIKYSGHFMVDFIGADRHMSFNSKKHLPYYFIDDYLDGIKVKRIYNVATSEKVISYNVSGNYMNIAKKDGDLTLFPFLDILVYDDLLENMPAVYIDFPQTINVKLQIKNGGKLPDEVYVKEQVGNEKFSADFYTEKVGNDYFINQKLTLNLLHSSLTDHTAWNDFVSKVKTFNNYPLNYE